MITKNNNYSLISNKRIFFFPDLNFRISFLDILKCPILKIPEKNLKTAFFPAIVTVQSQKHKLCKKLSCKIW